MADQFIGDLTDGAAPVDSDKFVVERGGTTNAWLTWAYLKAALGTAATLAADTDTSLAANSDLRVATQKATKAYVDALLAAQDVLVFKGGIDCSASPNYPAASAGHFYKVTVAGKIGGASGAVVQSGDSMYCTVDGSAAGTQAAVGANWVIVQVNIDGAVVGPASATDGHVALFDGATGKLLKDSGLTLAGTNTGDETGARLATLHHAASVKSALVDADEVTGGDSAASFGLIRTTWTSVKAFLKTYFDTLYALVQTVIAVTPSGTLNDYAPGACTTLNMAPTTAVIMTGLLAGTDGQQKTLRNKGSPPIVLCHENAGSSAANRFTLTVGVNRGHVVLWPGDACVIEYDGTAARWVLVQEKSATGERWVRRMLYGNQNSTSTSAFGVIATTANTVSAAIASGSYIAETSRTNVTTTATINTLGIVRVTGVSVFPGDTSVRGGFLARQRFGFVTIPSTAGAFFAGVRTNNNPVATSNFSSQFTNTPTIGFGVDNTQSTLRFWKAATSVAIDTSNDLGANFPFTAGACYDCSIFMPPGGGSVGWVIARTDDLTITPKAGYETSGIPATTDGMAGSHCIGNFANAAYISAFMGYDQFTPN